jgi:hypothetical protein
LPSLVFSSVTAVRGDRCWTVSDCHGMLRRMDANEGGGVAHHLAPPPDSRQYTVIRSKTPPSRWMPWARRGFWVWVVFASFYTFSHVIEAPIGTSVSGSGDTCTRLGDDYRAKHSGALVAPRVWLSELLCDDGTS